MTLTFSKTPTKILSKGTGASGSFKIGEVVKPKQKPAAKPKKAVKPKAEERENMALGQSWI
jgi:hypothetical protein